MTSSTLIDAFLSWLLHNRGGGGGCNAGAPSVLVAYGRRDAELLASSGIRGAFVDTWGL